MLRSVMSEGSLGGRMEKARKGYFRPPRKNWEIRLEKKTGESYRFFSREKWVKNWRKSLLSWRSGKGLVRGFCTFQEGVGWGSDQVRSVFYVRPPFDQAFSWKTQGRGSEGSDLLEIVLLYAKSSYLALYLAGIEYPSRYTYASKLLTGWRPPA